MATTVYTDDMLVCVDCTMLTSNGTVGNEDSSEDEEHTVRMISANSILMVSYAHLVIVEHEPEGFYNRCCDGCGSALSGDRWKAVILTSHTNDPAREENTNMLNIKRPQVTPCHMSNDEQCIAQVGSDNDLGGYLFVKCEGIIDGAVHWMWRVFDADMMQVMRSDQGDNNSIQTPLGFSKTPIQVMSIFVDFLCAVDPDSDSVDTTTYHQLKPLYDWIGWNRDELDTLTVDLDERYELSTD